DARTQLLTRIAGEDSVLLPSAPPSEKERILRQNPVVFETMHSATLFEDNNDLFFYTWGDSQCCLPKGATRATLRDHKKSLAVGQVIVLEEVLGPRTHRPEDADPSHRHAVRLVNVLNDEEDPVNSQKITEIRWHPDDALPFPLCISSQKHPDGAVAEDVSRATGNIVLADHGRTITGESLGTVPSPHLFLVPKNGAARCDRPDPVAVPPRFRPALMERPLTQHAPLDSDALPPSASAAIDWDQSEAMPAATLSGDFEGAAPPWHPRHDLLASDDGKRHFVAEVDSDGAVFIRFGDDHHGMRPQSGTQFEAEYRVGNGAAGNIGADSIAHIYFGQSGIHSVRNPLPGHGGVEPESIEQVRQRAPYAFRVQQRAVTPKDYEEVSLRHPEVQRAAATFRWTGSWHTVFVTVDRFGGRPVDDGFETEL
ncbi:MAG: putative baseplate assembly protein, partial [bacterium]|nr:putative baseplate assembly protein [bacterium]